MKKKIFIIKYKVKDISGNTMKMGKIKVKNKMSSLHAQTSLEDYLKRNVKCFNRLEVLSCVEENSFASLLNDLGVTDNPFNFNA